MRKKAYILLIIAIAIITTIIVGMFFLMRKYESTVLAGANIAGVDAGGKNIDDAMTQIEAELSIFLEKKVVILASDQVAEFLPADLGIGFDYEKTKNSLPTMRSLSGILRGVYLFVSGQEIVPSVVIDEEKLFSTISILNLEFDAQNAYLSLDPVSKEVILNAESSGIKMDRESFQQDLNKKFEDLSEDSITINLFEIEPAIISADIEPFMDQAGNILTKKITISYDSDEWIFSASDYSYLLSFGTKSTFAEDFGITWSDGEQNENAKENSKAPENSPVIGENWDLERVDFIHFAKPSGISRPQKTETCYKLMPTRLAKTLNLQAKHFEFEPEITAKILKKGIRIWEVPISYAGREYHEGKKISWKDSIPALWTLVKERLTP